MVKTVNPSSITVVSPQAWAAPTVVVSGATRAAPLANDKTKPTTPPNFTAVAFSTTEADLAWGESTDPIVPGQVTSGLKGYRVFRNSVKIAQVNASVRTYRATGLTPGNNNQWRVASFDNRNNQSVLSAQITVLQPSAPPVPDDPDTTAPTVPTNLLATTQGETQINLTWSASTDPIVSGQEDSGLAGYKVYRDTALIATLGLVTTYPNTGLTAGTEYSYRVSAIDVAGNESAQSAASVASTTSPGLNPDVTAPSIPSGVAAAAQSSSSIEVTWSASTDPVIGGAETSGVAGYKVRRGGTLIATVGLVTEYLDSGLTPSTVYSYTVAAVDVAGNESSQSGSVQATTGSVTGGDTINAASASRADVLAAIAQASPGDTVVVPAGSVSWSGGISITGITLQGPGKSAGSPTNISAGLVTITKHASELTRLIGFRFTGTDQHLAIGGALSARAFVVDNCHFHNAGAEWCNMTTNGGLFCRNTITAPTPHSADVFRINLGGPGGNGLVSWQAAHSMGSADSTGETNTYFEDNHWTNLLEVCVDVDNGARVVMRHEIFQDSSVVYHGGGSGSSGQDSSSYGGRHLEMYDCTFDRVDQGALSALNKWIWVRGGGGFVFVDNAVDDNSTGQYPNKREIILSCGCPGSPAYPMQYQVGQSTQTPDATPNHPALIYGNTGTGAGAGLVFISGTSGAGITCGNPGNYIQSGRDYVTSNTWGWAKYQYPHPLRP